MDTPQTNGQTPFNPSHPLNGARPHFNNVNSFGLTGNQFLQYLDMVANVV